MIFNTDRINQIVSKYDRKMTEAEASTEAAALVKEMVRELENEQADAAIRRRLNELSQADLSWKTPNVAGENPMNAIKLREEAIARFATALDADKAVWDHHRTVIFGGLKSAAMIALGGGSPAAIALASGPIVEGLMALSGK